MACAAAITIDIQAIQPAQPGVNGGSATYYLEPGSANGPITVNAQSGEMDFHQLNQCIQVTMNLTGYAFYTQTDPSTGKYVKDALMFSDAVGGTKAPVLQGKNDRQFKHLPFTLSNGGKTITFKYHNTNSHGQYPQSSWGIYLANLSDGSSAGELDPIVDNGGNPVLEARHKARAHRARHHRRR